MCLTSVINDRSRLKKDEDGTQDYPLLQRLNTNQKVTMYYMRRKKATQIKLTTKKDDLEIKKPYVREFEGNFYRSYPFLSHEK